MAWNESTVADRHFVDDDGEIVRGYVKPTKNGKGKCLWLDIQTENYGVVKDWVLIHHDNPRAVHHPKRKVETRANQIAL